MEALDPGSFTASGQVYNNLNLRIQELGGNEEGRPRRVGAILMLSNPTSAKTC